PDHEIGLHFHDVAIEALQHLADIFAAHAAVHDANRNAGEVLLEFGFEPRRIGRARIARADALGRGRAEGDDSDRFFLRDARSDMNEAAVLEAGDARLALAVAGNAIVRARSARRDRGEKNGEEKRAQAHHHCSKLPGSEPARTIKSDRSPPRHLCSFSYTPSLRIAERSKMPVSAQYFMIS